MQLIVHLLHPFLFSMNQFPHSLSSTFQPLTSIHSPIYLLAQFPVSFLQPPLVNLHSFACNQQFHHLNFSYFYHFHSSHSLTFQFLSLPHPIPNNFFHSFLSNRCFLDSLSPISLSI